MISLVMDTSNSYLAVGLFKDNMCLEAFQEKGSRRQSEKAIPTLKEVLDRHHIALKDVNEMIITSGPGSYTGVRIAMTVAKVFCAMADKPIYTVSTLLLYAGKKNCRVVTDARGKRVYTCLFFDGKALEEERAVEIENLEIGDVNIVGDGALVGRQDEWPDIVDNFLELKDEWEKHDNVHLVVPEYLKSSASYLPQKKA